ncbi:MAG TPA: transaldolase family protein, partial [Armatimonadota bacterium]
MATMTALNPLLQLEAFGQSVWLDNFRRAWIVSGELERMVKEYGLKGVTTNPTIFEKAVLGSNDYDEAIRALVDQGLDTKEIYETLMIEDIRMAADVLKPVYNETDGLDGYVSIELPPSIARDTESTIFQAKRFHKLVDRENILVKVPGTLEGIPAIEQLTYEGINVNITLLFSNARYEQIAKAYIKGLRRRVDAGKMIGRIASVASFFVSRIDTAVD